ncbi:MAG: tRNA threonylcarbamoyladenosine dehydratase [Bacteroidales bacterium]|nr:tRNA threonylcarbamoyladenosine dehydratase [Candidatus Cacconaster merdequi]
MWTDRTEILIGKDGLERLASSTVVVVGLGGVGAVAAEMVARAGVGRMTIIDCDTVSETNLNRQIIALGSTVGRNKTDAVAERLLDINARLSLDVRKIYLTEDNIPEVFAGITSGASGKLFVIDAIDTLSPKLSLIKYCVDNAVPLVSSMGSGAKYDVTKIRIADVSKSFNCPLAYIVRKKLRHLGISKGFKVVFSEELPDQNAIVEMTPEEMAVASNKKSQVGTISYLPAAFGCACAQEALRVLLGHPS